MSLAHGIEERVLTNAESGEDGKAHLSDSGDDNVEIGDDSDKDFDVSLNQNTEINGHDGEDGGGCGVEEADDVLQGYDNCCGDRGGNIRVDSGDWENR